MEKDNRMGALPQSDQPKPPKIHPTGYRVSTILKPMKH